MELFNIESGNNYIYCFHNKHSCVECFNYCHIIESSDSYFYCFHGKHSCAFSVTLLNEVKTVFVVSGMNLAVQV